MTHEQQKNVSSLVNDLVTMAQATARLPEVERENDDLRAASLRDGDTIARLERKLIERSAELDTLYTKLREVESERDDAGFRELEAQDKVNALRDMVEGVISDLGHTLGTVDGTDRIRVLRVTEGDRKAFLEWKAQREEIEKGVPFATTIGSSPPSEAAVADIGSSGLLREGGSVEPYTPPSIGWGQADATEVREEPRPTTSVATEATLQSTVPSESVASQESVASTEGQSDPLPTPVSASPEPAPFTSVTSQDGASSPGRYTGKRYYDHPYYVSEESWVANGGTLEDYHWRPTPNVA